MGFNRRKLEDQSRTAAEKEVAARRATDAQVLEDAERLSPCGTSARASECRCCSRRPSALPLPLVIGFCECVARRTGRATK
jgi:hypothetical protein